MLKKILCILLSLITVCGVFAVTNVFSATAVSENNSSDGGETEACAPLQRRDKTEAIVPVGTEVYQIVVGKTVVTSDNCGDILKNGKASYDPSTKTLNLKNPVINEAYGADFGVIDINTPGVTVTGSFHMSAAKSNHGLGSAYPVTLNGSFTFYGKANGVTVNDRLTVSGGTLKAVGTLNDDASGVYVPSTGSTDGEIVIGSQITKIEAQGRDTAVVTDKMTFNQTKITSPRNAYFSPYYRTVALADNSAVARSVVIEPFSGTFYDLWVGTTHVDSSNCANVCDDGKVSFDPASNTLTLNNPTIVGSYTKAVDANTFKIYTERELTIKGSYRMNVAESYGVIRATKGVTFDGSFNLRGTAYGVLADGDITVKAGSLTVSGKSSGALVTDSGTVAVQSGATKLDASSDVPPVLAKAIRLGSGMVVSIPRSGVIAPDSGGRHQIICDANGQPVTRALIEPYSGEPAIPYDLMLGETVVTDKNCHDIFGDGSAQYDPVTKTLTLNDPVITGVYSAGDQTFKIFSLDDLTVKGRYHMTTYDAYRGIYSDKSLVLDGSFTFLSAYNAVYAADSITLTSGSLKAVCTESAAIFSDGVVNIKNETAKIEAQSWVAAILAPSVVLDPNVRIITPADARYAPVRDTDYITVADADYTVAKDLVIEGLHLLGDADVDGDVTILDATWIQRQSAMLRIPIVLHETCADVDGSGEADVIDATLIQRYLAEIKTSYRIGEPI